MNKEKICPICKDVRWKDIMKYVVIDQKFKININYLIS